MKRKILMFLMAFGILSLTGCSDLINTPTRKTEELLGKYQILDKDITGEIDDLINQSTLTTDQKSRYRQVLEKQYKNLVYDVKEEKIDGDTAIVTVEIEVLDYRNAISDMGNNENMTDNYLEERLLALESAKDKVKYTLEISLSKVDKQWVVNPLSETDIKKIQGMY